MQCTDDEKENIVILGSGDSHLLVDLMPHHGAHLIDRLLVEIPFKEMTHKGGIVPRLVATQYQSINLPNDQDVQHGPVKGYYVFEPIYRHPTKDSFVGDPFSPTVIEIKNHIEGRLNQKFNHVLIQMYRGGKDYINEHSDKTLDILRGSNIINFSLGASRTLYLKPKKDLPISSLRNAKHKIVLLHNSLFVCGWNTNFHYVHGIKPDKRLAHGKRADELLYNETRISLTFRNIATFQCRPLNLLVGQGARRKGSMSVYDNIAELLTEIIASISNEDHNLDPNSLRDESIRLIEAFSIENKSALFDWDSLYGGGFDIMRILDSGA